MSETINEIKMRLTLTHESQAIKILYVVFVNEKPV